MTCRNMLTIALAATICGAASAQNLTMDDLLRSSEKPVKADAPPGALVVNGQPAATIVIPAEPSDQILFATKQLQTYVEKMSSAVLPVATANDEVAGNRILLGVPDLTQETGASVPEDLDEESYLIKSAGRDLVIVGGSDRGSLYGVCGLLEDHLGVRWYVAGDPLGDCVPEMQDIVLEDVDDQQSPSFPMRWIGTDSDWGVTNRQNGRSASLEAGFKIEPGIYHTQEVLLPHSEYFEEHPEYFALIKGERSNLPRCKLCYSNPEVAREVARRMAEMLEADQDIDLISFSPTDGQSWCRCDGCRAMDESDVSSDRRMSRRSLLFYNAIAAELRRTHPEAKILVGAYNVYNRPPRDPSIKADPMLAVVITHYEDYCMAHPVADPACPRNVRYVELIEQWENLGCDVYYYEYYCKGNWSELPWPIVHSIKEDMPWYYRRGHQGVYTQFNEVNAWTLFPAYYVAAKLMWNVDADVDAMFDEMCNRLFGKGGPAIREYYRVMEDSMANCGRHFPGHGITSTGGSVFTEEVLAAMGQALQRAHELATDELVQQRLAKIDLSYEYTCRLMAHVRARHSIETKETPQEALAAAEEALRLYDELVAEVVGNPEKWEGVVRDWGLLRPFVHKRIESLKRRIDELRAEVAQQDQ